MGLAKQIGHWIEDLSAIGARPAGTPANGQARMLITEVLQQNGFSVDLQEYPCPWWELTSSEFTVGGKLIPAVISPFSPSCDVTGPLVFARNLEELVARDFTGSIMVLTDELTSTKFAPKNFDYFRDENQDRIIALVEAKNPLALVLITPQQEVLVPYLEDSDFPLPVINLDHNALSGTEGREGRLVISAWRQAGQGANIVARRILQGDGPRLLLCAHYDTKYGTPGALDNAAGTATLLGVASLLKEADLPLGLELVFFGGEDSWWPGEVSYGQVNSTELQNNFGKYLQLTGQEDIYITRNGIPMAKLTRLTEGDVLVFEKAKKYSSVAYQQFLELTADSPERYELIDGRYAQALNGLI